MDVKEFWALVDAACAEVDNAGPGTDERYNLIVRACVDRLAERTPDQIVQFGLREWELKNRAYRLDIWAAAYIIEGGCGDDSFIDFRSGLISWGREWYERALADPDSLVDHPAAQDRADAVIGNEDFGYVASMAHARVTGDKDAYSAAVDSSPEFEALRSVQEPAGENWDFDDADEMRRRLPRLAAAVLD